MAAHPPIIPVLLAGGTGSRLWPLSRPERPKQFLPLLAEGSPFAAACRRYAGAGFAPPVVVTAPCFAPLVQNELRSAGVMAARLLLEPQRRSTAAAALAAAELVQRDRPDALVLIAPTDHAIDDGASLRATILAARDAALAGALVTIGIRPTHPSSELGWIVLGESEGRGEGRAPLPRPVLRFVEKPPPAEAARLHADHRSLWNAGLVLATARSLLAAGRAHAGALAHTIAQACHGGRDDGAAFHPDAGPWGAAQTISLDRAVLERAGNMVSSPWAGHWSDLGTWEALVAARAHETLLASPPDPVYASGQAALLAGE